MSIRFALPLSLVVAFAGVAADAGEQLRPVFAGKLPNVTGKALTAILVSYAPGGKSTKHQSLF